MGGLISFESNFVPRCSQSFSMNFHPKLWVIRLLRRNWSDAPCRSECQVHGFFFIAINSFASRSSKHWTTWKTPWLPFGLRLNRDSNRCFCRSVFVYVWVFLGWTGGARGAVNNSYLYMKKTLQWEHRDALWWISKRVETAMLWRRQANKLMFIHNSCIPQFVVDVSFGNFCIFSISVRWK